jgi:hypothetical protein
VQTQAVPNTGIDNDAVQAAERVDRLCDHLADLRFVGRITFDNCRPAPSRNDPCSSFFAGRRVLVGTCNGRTFAREQHADRTAVAYCVGVVRWSLSGTDNQHLSPVQAPAPTVPSNGCCE